MRDFRNDSFAGVESPVKTSAAGTQPSVRPVAGGVLIHGVVRRGYISNLGKVIFWHLPKSF
jgi:hypothetical protein